MKRFTVTLAFGMLISALTVGFLVRPAMAQAFSPQSNCGKWKIVSSPTVDGILNGVTTVPSRNVVWAVGATLGGQTLTESYCRKK